MCLKIFNLLSKCNICCFTVFFASSIWAAPEKICDSEPALFQCQVRGGKNLALCPNYSDGKLTGIQYRFGRKINKELTFPSNSYDFKVFSSNHYVRYQVDYKRVKFSIGAYEYSIYSDYDGENAGEESKKTGVVISNKLGKPDIQIPCTHIYADNLEKVIPLVKCDSDDALGCSK